MAMNKNVIVIDNMRVWNAQKPKYNGFAGGYGVHGNTKYSRKVKYKKDWREW